MKVTQPSRLSREALTDAPAGEYVDRILEKINADAEQTNGALMNNLNFADNMNAAIVKYRFTHGTELKIPNPLKTRPVGIYAIRSTAIDGGTRYAIDSLDWRFIDSGDPKSPQQIGVTAKYDQATTGYIGEAARSYVSFASRTALTNATAKTVTSISLTTGDWDISIVCGIGGGALVGTALYAAISTATNTLAADYADNIIESSVMPTAAVSSYITIPSYRVSLTAASTTYYMVAQANFTPGATSAWGRISAVRATKLDTAVQNNVTLLVIGG